MTKPQLQTAFATPNDDKFLGTSMFADEFTKKSSAQRLNENSITPKSRTNASAAAENRRKKK